MCVVRLEELYSYELLRPGEIISSDLCCQQLMRLKQEVEKKRSELINRKGAVFHQDNVRQHTSLTAQCTGRIDCGIWCCVFFEVFRLEGSCFRLAHQKGQNMHKLAPITIVYITMRTRQLQLQVLNFHPKSTPNHHVIK
ncbi:hypothetical protein EVAR_31474_1 [Eumeta japonica]|uniref:Mariner Mos1 transposase n=1 Tax=Eumeta variegata TaxID=151549 RepID=A0A4C1WCP8_EUMVA|nr:hypothetical protein EVAR_31474_1 [Eumeta japonica]